MGRAAGANAAAMGAAAWTTQQGGVLTHTGEMQAQAHLSGGEWRELLPPEHPGIAEVKWCRNRFRPFLCIQPQARRWPSAPALCALCTHPTHGTPKCGGIEAEQHAGILAC